MSSIWSEERAEHERMVAQALDPNTPPLQLIQLLEEFPNEVVRNPAFELMQLERPDLWRELIQDFPRSAYSLARSARIPPAFVNYYVENHFHDGCSILFMLNQDIDPAIRLRLFTDNPTPPLTRGFWEKAIGARLATLLDRLGFSDGGNIKPADDLLDAEISDAALKLGQLGLFAAVRHPRCPPLALQRAAEYRPDSNHLEALRVEVAKHPNLSPETAEMLSSDSVLWVRQNIARRKDLNPELLRKLAQDPKEQVQTAAAGNPHLPDDVALKLATKSPAAVRRGLAANPNLSETAMRILCKDRLEKVRQILANNAKSTPAICGLLAQDAAPGVRLKLASKKHVPRDVIDRLALDAHSGVADAARKTQKKWE